MEDTEEVIKKLTLEEKIALVSGHNFMYTNEIRRLDIPSLRMSDGPHGLRVQQEKGDNGVNPSAASTCFPTAATVASSWNPANSEKIGKAIAKEAKHYGIDVVLGPGCNIKRNPLGGRNFEYFSEDPLLSGRFASAEVRGIQKEGKSACLKHFALNNQENYRFLGDSISDMRAMREIYLKPFEMVVKEGYLDAVMCSYNKINGTYASENSWLLDDVLRKEWHFDGLVMTDWGASHDRKKMLQASLDLEMPGDTPICRKMIADSIKDASLSMEDLDRACVNVLNLAEKHAGDKKEEVDFKANADVALDVALDSAVLLKNDSLLPLDKEKKYAVFGELFEKPRYQGAGSSMIQPTSLITPRDAFESHDIKYAYAKGYLERETEVSEDVLKEAMALSKDYEACLVFLGLTDYVESEGADRQDMSLPKNQLALVDFLLKAGKKVCVILFGGSPVELPFADHVDSILDMYLPGQCVGEATCRLLLGEANPSGRLAETYPMSYQDVPFHDSFSKSETEVYKESIYVGYRYYLSAGKKVRYPFGYGLSYTSFTYSAMRLDDVGSYYILSLDVTNDGEKDGSEVIEVYLNALENPLFHPTRELKGFEKVFLKSKEKKRVGIKIKKADLRYYDVSQNRFVFIPGDYLLEVCKDCRTPIFSEKIHVEGAAFTLPYSKHVNEIYTGLNIDEITDDVFKEMSGLAIPEKKKHTPITLESRFSYLKESSFMGRFLYSAVLGVAKKQRKKALRMEDSPEKENMLKGALFLGRIMDSNSLITMSMSASDSFPYNFALAFMDMANGHLIRGVKDFLSKIKAPELPENGEKKK